MLDKKKSIEPFSFKNHFSCQANLWSKSVQINLASLGGSSEWSDLVDVANGDAGKVEFRLWRRDRFDAGDGRRRRKLGPVDHHEEHGHADGGLMQEFVSLSILWSLNKSWNGLSRPSVSEVISEHVPNIMVSPKIPLKHKRCHSCKRLCRAIN